MFVPVVEIMPRSVAHLPEFLLPLAQWSSTHNSNCSDMAQGILEIGWFLYVLSDSHHMVLINENITKIMSMIKKSCNTQSKCILVCLVLSAMGYCSLWHFALILNKVFYELSQALFSSLVSSK